MKIGGLGLLMGERADRVPNANSPQVLWRMLEWMASGLRQPRGLHEALGIEPRTVDYYLQAAEWLGLLDRRGDLTADGLELAWAGPDAAAVHARIVRNHAVARRWLGAKGLADTGAIQRDIATAEPELSHATVARRASAVRGLLAPALDVSAAAPPSHEAQLHLPLVAPARRGEALGRSDFDASDPQDPGLYAVVLGQVAEYGELALGHLRALLDSVGAREAGLGDLVDLGLKRGDFARVGERIVIREGGLARRSLTGSALGVALTDPGYRAWLGREAVGTPDAKAARWDRRFFGGRPSPAALREKLATWCPDRPLDAIPVAGERPREPRPVEAPFVDAWESDGRVLAWPPTMHILLGGVGAVNRLLRDGRGRTAVGMPDALDRPVLVHGSLVAPGEAIPRAVPDARSLRIRAVTVQPYLCLTAALLFLHRRSRDRISVVRKGAGWGVAVDGVVQGELGVVLDRVATRRGWLSCRPPAVDGGVFVDSLIALDAAMAVDRRLTMGERFFGLMRSEPEEAEVSARLGRLAQAIEGDLAP